MEASGNGDIYKIMGSQTGVELGSFKNSGVISGETEIHHGNSQRKYTRIAHKNSGAGVAVGGDVLSKIENTGTNFWYRICFISLKEVEVMPMV